MKTIKNLKVTVTYTVGFENVQVSDEVFEQLENNSEINSDDIECSEAIDWLSDNINESDGLDFSYDISDIEES